MFQGRKVVSVTPYGRRRYVEILAHYLLSLRDVIDEHHFWINTDCREDLKYVRHLAAAYPDFFHLVYDSSRYSKKSAVPRLCWFWQKCDEPDTLYLRFDDDVVWIDAGAVERLLQFRLDHPHYLAVFPNTINNSLCSHLHQRMGLLGESPVVEYECLGEVSWRRWQTARDCHEKFFELLAAGGLARYHFQTWELQGFERFSINAMCWQGHDLIGDAQRFQDDEEAWVTEILPREKGRANCIVGDALVAHYAYAPQRAELEARTAVLARYKSLVPAQAEELSAAHTIESHDAPARRWRYLQAATGMFRPRRAAA